MRIGEVARAAEVNVQTLRFDEREGVLKPPRRGHAGYREYPPETVGVVRFIKQVQSLGFTLREAREMLRLRDRRRMDCDQVRAASRGKIAVIEDKIERLVTMKAALESLIASCDAPDSTECPLVDALIAGTVRYTSST